MPMTVNPTWLFNLMFHEYRSTAASVTTQSVRWDVQYSDAMIPDTKATPKHDYTRGVTITFVGVF
jgi:hypothetical protein